MENLRKESKRKRKSQGNFVYFTYSLFQERLEEVTNAFETTRQERDGEIKFREEEVENLDRSYAFDKAVGRQPIQNRGCIYFAGGRHGSLLVFSQHAKLRGSAKSRRTEEIRAQSQASKITWRALS